MSESFFKSLKPAIKSKVGLKVSLTQVTSKGSPFSGYAVLPLFFDTENGPVEITVDAYIVPNMSTSFLLGNDFAEQYNISIVRNEGVTKVSFGQLIIVC
jgi:hypothetical protein